MQPKKMVMALKKFFHINIITLKKCITMNTWSLIHINTCSLNRNFDGLQHLFSCTKTKFDIIVISETRIRKWVSSLNNLNLNNYSLDFTPTETSTGGIILYIANHLSYKCRNYLTTYKKTNLNLLLLKLSIQKNQMSLWELLTGIHLWILLGLIAII